MVSVRFGTILLGIVIALVVLSCASAVTDERDAAAKRVVEFLTDAHTGKAMKAEEWLTSDARDAPLFSGFGGLDSLVKQSTARAERYGGLRSVVVRNAARVIQGYDITAEVTFKIDHKVRDGKSASANEDMIWEFHLVRQDGTWKIAR